MAIDKLISLLKGNALFLKQASNLSDLGTVATARTNLDVYSKSEIDNVTIKKDTDADVAIANDNTYDTYQMTKTLAGGTSTYTLPASPTTGLRKVIQLIQQSTSFGDYLILNGNGKTINGESTWQFNGDGDYISIEYDGVEWKHKGFQSTYETNGEAFINRSDWVGVVIGSDPTKDADSNISHNLNVTSDKLDVIMIISTTNSESTAFFKFESTAASTSTGFTIHDEGLNALSLYTNARIYYTNKTFTASTIGAQDWYYKIIVRRVKK